MALILKRVGRYEILKEIGRGGMATVYLARQTDLDRLRRAQGARRVSLPGPGVRRAVPARVADGRSLCHPNIVTVHDYFEHEGTPYIAMEYIERGSLRPYVDEDDVRADRRRARGAARRAPARGAAGSSTAT